MASTVSLGRQAQFQSTLPVWGETDVSQLFTKSFTISIHPPRVGRDKSR